jgi:urease accessory protein
MHATARIVAAAGDGGHSRLPVLRSEAPLLVRRTGPATVHLVGGAAGPLGGDRLRLSIEVGPGADLTVGSVAATVALPPPAAMVALPGAGWSRTDVVVEVAAGGRLRWLPEPLVAAAGCRHEAVTTVDLAPDARLVWRDELVCGRHGEEPGDATLRATVRLDGRPLYRHDLAVGPHAPGWAGGAVLGGARAYGSLLVVNEPPPEVPATLMALAGPGVLAVAVGPDARAVRAALSPK